VQVSVDPWFYTVLTAQPITQSLCSHVMVLFTSINNNNNVMAFYQFVVKFVTVSC